MSNILLYYNCYEDLNHDHHGDHYHNHHRDKDDHDDHEYDIITTNCNNRETTAIIIAYTV